MTLRLAVPFGVAIGCLVALNLPGCTDPDDTGACYHVWKDWYCEAVGPDRYSKCPYCDYAAGEYSPLFGEYQDLTYRFMTCDEVALDDSCQTCPSDDIDDKVFRRAEAVYERYCPDRPHELVEFERGCMIEVGPDEIDGSFWGHEEHPDKKLCCYLAIVVGECLLPSYACDEGC